MAGLSTSMTIVFATAGTIAEATSIGNSGTSRPTVNVTHLTTAGAYMNFLLGVYADGGQIDVEAFLLPKVFAALLTEDEQQITISFRLESGDATPTTYVFNGGCTSEDFAGGAVDEAMTSSLAFKVLDAPTITPGAP